MKISFCRCHALRVEDGAFSQKRDNVTTFFEILNRKRYPYRITGSRVTAFLLNRWILPIVGASAVEGLQSMGLPCLVNSLTH